jgi:hypothetical protein
MTPRPPLGPDAIRAARLANQRLVPPHAASAPELVAWLGAVQSQDYVGALWALALRHPEASRPALHDLVARGEILRTHVLRPTWHFVAPQDIRWLLGLTGARIRRAMASRERDLGMDQALVHRSFDVLIRALGGGRSLTRAELGAALTQGGVDWRADLSVLSHLVSAAELAALVCSGPPRGALHTWALLDERVPPTAPRPPDEAVADLVGRYFASHGPATLTDFAWWSGLTIGDARRGLAALGSRFASATLDDLTYWFEPAAMDSASIPAPADGSVLLLPNYDEYVVAYRARQLLLPPVIAHRPEARYDPPFSNLIVIEGVAAGVWIRTVQRGQVTVRPWWFNEPSVDQVTATESAIAAYLAFATAAP